MCEFKLATDFTDCTDVRRSNTHGPAGGQWGFRDRASKRRDPGTPTGAHAWEHLTQNHGFFNPCESVESVANNAGNDSGFVLTVVRIQVRT